MCSAPTCHMTKVRLSTNSPHRVVILCRMPEYQYHWFCFYCDSLFPAWMRHVGILFGGADRLSHCRPQSWQPSSSPSLQSCCSRTPSDRQRGDQPPRNIAKRVNLWGANVLVCVNLNVPLSKGDGVTVTDDTRLRAIVPTTKFLFNKGANVILSSHFGRRIIPQE